MDFDVSDDEQQGHVKKRRLEDVDTFEVNSDLGSDFEDEEITSEEDDELPPLPPVRSKRDAPLPTKRRAAAAAAAARGGEDAELASLALVESDGEDELSELDDGERGARGRAAWEPGGDDDSADEAPDGELDPAAHASMLNTLGLARGRRGGVRVRSEMLPEGDHAIGTRAGLRNSSDAGGELTVARLLSAVDGTAEFGTLRSKLGQAERAAARHALPAPAERTDRARAERSAAASVVDAELTKWTSAVKALREAETLSFPMDVSKPERSSTAALADKFTPRTSLEQRVAKVLQQHGMAERQLGQAEAKALEAMPSVSAEEARARLAELKKSRDLLFHHERKLKRIHKVKSKAYRRLRRKADDRAAARAEAEQLEGSDPVAAAEAQRRLEQERLIERVSQKHRNTSKWARRMLTHRANQADPATRSAIAEQLQLGEELRRRPERLGADASDDESESERSGEPTDSDSDEPHRGGGGGGGGDGGDGEEELGVGLGAEGAAAAALADGERARRRIRRRRRVLEQTMAQLAGMADAEGSEAAGGGGALGKGILALPFMQRGLQRRQAEVVAELKAVREEMALALAAEEEAEADGADADGARAQERAHRRAQLEADGAPLEEAGLAAARAARRAYDGKAPAKAAGKAAGKGAAAAGAKGKGAKGRSKPEAEAEEEAEAEAEAGLHGWAGDEALPKPQTQFGVLGQTQPQPQPDKRAAAAAAAATAGGKPSRAAARTGLGSTAVAMGAAVPVHAAKGPAPAAQPKPQPQELQPLQQAQRRKGSQAEPSAAPASKRAKSPQPRGTLALTDASEQARAAAADRALSGDAVSPYHAGTANAADDEDGGDAQDAAYAPLMSAEQRALVELAFPATGVEVEFAADKAAATDAELPRDLKAGGAPELPGWGSWAGQGTRPSKRAEGRKAEREAELRAKIRAAAAKRKDSGLAHVQLSERRDKKLAKYTLEAVPYPYTSREQYERAVRHPLGKEWNTTQEHEQLTQKRITIAAGAIIEPIAQHRKAR